MTETTTTTETKDSKEAQANAELKALMPDLVAQRNNVDLTLHATYGKKKGWEGIPYYKGDVKGLEIAKLVAWVGEDFVRKTIGQRLNLIFQEAMWRATHKLTGKKIKNEKGEEEDEYEDKEFDKEMFLKAVTDLRQASGRTISELNEDMQELIDELASASDEVEQAKKSGDAKKLMDCMTAWMEVSKEITSIQAELKGRKRPRAEK